VKYLIHFSDFFDTTILAVLESFFTNISASSKDLSDLIFLKYQLSVLIVFAPCVGSDFVYKLKTIIKDHLRPKFILVISKSRDYKLSQFCAENQIEHYCLLDSISVLTAICNQFLKNLDHLVLEYADLKLDKKMRAVIIGSKTVFLSNMEFELLKYLVSNSGRAISKIELLEQVWGHNVLLSTRTVDVHVSRLRKKIDLPFDTNYIQTVHCYGYVIS